MYQDFSIFIYPEKNSDYFKFAELKAFYKFQLYNAEIHKHDYCPGCEKTRYLITDFFNLTCAIKDDVRSDTHINVTADFWLLFINENFKSCKRLFSSFSIFVD